MDTSIQSEDLCHQLFLYCKGTAWIQLFLKVTDETV